jgi:hypothetical protein
VRTSTAVLAIVLISGFLVGHLAFAGEIPTPTAPTPTPTPVRGASAATPEANPYTTIRISANSLNMSFGQGQTARDSLESLTAVVNQRICASIDTRGPSSTDSDGNKVLIIGTSDQARECQRSTGTIVLYQRHAIRQFVEVPIQPGTSRLITNLAPQPPGFGDAGFLTLTLTIDGVRQIGDGEGVGEGPLLMVLPVNPDLPGIPMSALGELSVRQLVPFLYPFERNSEVPLVLRPGQYLVGTSAVDLSLSGATETIAVRSTTLLAIPVIRVSVSFGDDRRLDLSATRVGASPQPSSIGPPNVGEAGLK